MNFKRKIKRDGNSLSVIIPSDIIKYLNWKENTSVVLTVNGNKIIISEDEEDDV